MEKSSSTAARSLLETKEDEVKATYGTMSAKLEERFEGITARLDGMSDQNVRNYDINKLVTLSAFSYFKGTVFHSKVLWKETLVTALIYWSVFLSILAFRWKGFSDFVGKESTIRAFISMFSTLIGLLLSFYTALNLGRWWQMHLAAQHLIEGSKKLTMMVAHGCTDDPVVLQTINRYARASMFLIFQASQMEEGGATPLEKAVKQGLLTPEEKDKLVKASPQLTFAQAETLWVWLANLITRLHNEGLTKGPPHYCALMGAVEEGRGGVATIQSYLGTPIPLGYAHLLCLMVKLHNFILSILMGLTSVMLWGNGTNGSPVGVFRTAFRAFFMPFLYNAILCINAEVTDPFGGDPGDFDWSNYDENMSTSNQSYATAVQHLPDFIQQFKAPKKPKADSSA